MRTPSRIIWQEYISDAQKKNNSRPIVRSRNSIKARDSEVADFVNRIGGRLIVKPPYYIFISDKKSFWMQ